MEILIAAILAGTCSALAAYAWRRRRGRQGGSAASPAPSLLEGESRAGERDLEDLRPGDVLLVETTDHVVLGIARLSDQSLTFCDCLLDEGTRRHCLVVWGQGSPWVLWGRRIRGLNVTDPPSELLEHGGKVYRLKRRGQASLNVEGEAEEGFPSGQCRYFEYAAPGADRLWIRWGERGFVAFAGQRLQRHFVSLLPGS